MPFLDNFTPLEQNIVVESGEKGQLNPQVVQSAASLGFMQLLTEDLNHSQVYGNVQVINPFKEIA